MKIKSISNYAVPIVLFTICLSLHFILACSSNKPSIHGLSDTPQLSSQIKLTFKPDYDNTLLTDKDVSELYEKALATGIDLDYKMISTDKKQGKLTFGKQGRDKYPVRVEVLVDVMKNRQTAFVYITVFSKHQETVDLTMIQFKDRYKSKF